jgi:redox-sensitive bicupin YhaK (pirin superfamily)
LLQIWILPDRMGVTPRYAEKSFAGASSGLLHLVASKSARGGSIATNQDADLWLGKLAPGDRITHSFAPKRHGWVHVAEGELTLNGQTLKGGDGAALSDERTIELGATRPSQVLVFDLN